MLCVIFLTEAGIRSHSGYGQHKKFLKYCFHGWITPLVWVGVCVAIEWTDTFQIGYGESCYVMLTTIYSEAFIQTKLDNALTLFGAWGGGGAFDARAKFE